MKVVIRVEKKHLWLIALCMLLMAAAMAQGYRHLSSRIEVTVNGNPMSFDDSLGKIACADAVRAESVSTAQVASNTLKLGGKLASEYR